MFFVNYEAYCEVFGGTQPVAVTVAQIRQGDLRDGIALNGIFDPLTTRNNPAGGAPIRDRFPGDMIRAGRFDRSGSGCSVALPQQG